MGEGVGGFCPSARARCASTVCSALVALFVHLFLDLVAANTTMEFLAPALLVPTVAWALLPALAAQRVRSVQTQAAALARRARQALTALHATPAASTLPAHAHLEHTQTPRLHVKGALLVRTIHLRGAPLAAPARAAQLVPSSPALDKPSALSALRAPTVPMGQRPALLALLEATVLAPAMQWPVLAVHLTPTVAA